MNISPLLAYQMLQSTLGQGTYQLGLLDPQLVELQTTGYARQNITFTVSNVDDAAYAENADVIDFPQLTEAWGDVAAYGIYDSLGNLLLTYFLPQVKTFSQSYQHHISSGEILVYLI